MSEENNPLEVLRDRTLKGLETLRGASGVVRVVIALQVRQVTKAWGWLAASGVATAVLGGIILLRWPASSHTTLGLLLGLDLLLAGLGWVLVGLALRRLTARVAN